MAIEVFWFSGSAPSWRVLLTLEIKQAPYRSRLLQVSKGEHRSPDHLAMNPRGKVPVIREGDFVLYESLAIMAYLERKFPEPALFGTTAEQTARVWQAISEFQCYLDAPFLRALLPVYFGQVEEQREDIEAALAELKPELAMMESRVAADGWLAGGAMSAADVAAYPFIQNLVRAAGKDNAKDLPFDLLPLSAQYPALADWVERMSALPGHERTYPPHWREAA